MSTLLIWREKIQKLYAEYSFYITKAARLVLGLLVFGLINANIGFTKTAASSLITIGLAVVCAFLPPIVMTVAAMALVLLHLYGLSIAVTLVAAAMFLLMYIFYLRFSTNQSWLILVTAAAFAFRVPLVIPIAAGLLGGFGSIAPVMCGTVAYYMIHVVKTSSGTFKSEGLENIVETITASAKQLLVNKEMWLMVAVVVVTTLLVYGIRTRSVNHAWKVASVAGAIIGMVLGLVGNILLSVHISPVSLIASAALAIVFGILAEMLFLSVDYTRTEFVEFEDDEYHYFVKAVPKIGVSVPEKNVKHITRHQNERQTVKEEHPVLPGKEEPADYPDEREINIEENTEDILLTRSLSKELGLEEPELNK